jgi:glucose-6-phosphate dehydrogenase assembly protein OpcA
VSVAADIERELASLRCARADGHPPELRTSTMTHLAWVPSRWLAEARATLAGMEERHPARTILLVPEPRRRDGVAATVDVREFELPGMATEVTSEIVEVRLRGRVAQHPASIVLPLLVSDLPVFCRWRGRPDFGSSALDEIVGVVDRLVVDSAEWRGLPRPYRGLLPLFDRVAVSDVAYRRGLPWRARLAERWPEIRSITTLRVVGPRADALLIVGWLRSRLRRRVGLVHRPAPSIESVAVDGEAVEHPLAAEASPSDLLSAELEALGRDPVYEAAVARAL